MQELSFFEWRKEINQMLGEKLMIDIDDLSDFDLKMAYEDGMDPEEAMLEALANDDVYCYAEEMGLL